MYLEVCLGYHYQSNCVLKLRIAEIYCELKYHSKITLYLISMHQGMGLNSGRVTKVLFEVMLTQNGLASFTYQLLIFYLVTVHAVSLKLSV